MEKTQHFKVIVSDRARAMLGAHIRFVAGISISAARKTRAELSKAIHSLSFMPERFPFFEDEYMPSGKYHKMFVEKWYLVLYQIKDQAIYVDYIVDCRQDYGWLVK